MTLVQTEPKSIKIWTTEIKRVTIRPGWVEKQIRPAWWQPWANTIAYYPLNNTTTVNDLSGNNRNLTNNWVVFWTYNGVNCAYFNWSGANLRANNVMSITTNIITLSMWVNKDRNSNNEIFQEIMDNGINDIQIPSLNGWTWAVGFSAYFGSTSNQTAGYSVTWVNNGIWRHIVFVWDGSSLKLYQNCQELPITYVRQNIAGLLSATYTTLILWWRDGVFAKWYISEAIFENKARTEQERLDYYNQTKWNYWL